MENKTGETCDSNLSNKSPKKKWEKLKTVTSTLHILFIESKYNANNYEGCLNVFNRIGKSVNKVCNDFSKHQK
jgi:hypothetical protein